MELVPGPTTAASELVARSASGDERAAAELARRYRPGMLSAAVRIVDPDAAEDVVQLALIESHRAIRQGARPDDPGSWMRGVACNCARDELRARLREPLALPSRAAPSAHEIAEQREAVRDIVAGVSELTHLQRESLVAQVLEGKSHHEIAVECATSVGSVRMAIARARRRLRRRLAVLAPLPLLETVRRGVGRLRDLASGGAGASAGVTAAVAVAVVAAAAVVDRSPRKGSESGVSQSVASAPAIGSPSGANGGERRSPAGAPRRDARFEQDPKPFDVAPSQATGPQQTTSSPANAVPSVPPSAPPATPPNAPVPPAEPPPLPIPPPELVGDPIPPPPAGECGPLSRLIPCVVETVGDVLQPG